MNTVAKWVTFLMLGTGVGIMRADPNSLLGLVICVVAISSWLEFCFKDLKDAIITEIRKTRPKD
jgi:hypothetical protein